MSHLNDAILDAYAEGQLTARERAEADAHLATCAQCRTGMVALAQVGDLLRLEPREAPPDDLAVRIMTNLAVAPPVMVKAGWSRARWIASGVGTTLLWLMLIVLAGETFLAAYRRGLGDLAELVRSHPEVALHYPSEAFYALVESVPAIEMMLTLVALVLGLWLLTQMLSALPTESRA